MSGNWRRAAVGTVLAGLLRFREAEVKAVLNELRDDAALATASVERLLREALCRLEPVAR